LTPTATQTGLACNETSTAFEVKGFPKPGLYKAILNIESEICDNCPKTVYLTVMDPRKQAETPEVHLVLVAGIAFAVLFVAGKK